MSGDFNIFSTHHTFSIHAIEDKDKFPPAYFHPPHFAFMRPAVRLMENYEIPWSYYFWHELFHAENLHLTNTGVMLDILNSLSENLAIYSLGQFASKNYKEGSRSLKMAVDMAKKYDLFMEYSLLTNEIPSTYFQVSVHTRQLVTQLVYDNIVTKFFKEIEKENVNNYINYWGDFVLSEIEKKRNERILEISREHEEAIRCGEKIRMLYNGIDYVHTIPIYSMDIDFSKLDFVTLNYQEIEKAIQKDHNNLNPQHRLNKIIKDGNKKYLSKLIENANEISNRCEEHIIECILSSSDLPDEIINAFSGSPNVDIDKVRAIKSMPVKEVFKKQMLYIEDNEFGTMFFIVPDYLTGNREEYYQNILSNTYAYELILRSFGSAKYSDEWMRLVKCVLNSLDEKIPEPSHNHTFAERYFKVSF